MYMYTKHEFFLPVLSNTRGGRRIPVDTDSGVGARENFGG